MSGGTDKAEAAVDALIDQMVAAGLIVRVAGGYRITAKGRMATLDKDNSHRHSWE